MEELLTLLKAQAKTTYALIKRIENYEKIRKESRTSAYEISKLLAEIKKTSENLPESAGRQVLCEWLSREEASVAKSKEDIRFNFGRELKSLLNQHGIDLKGQLPTLRAGLFTIRVDFEIGSSAIYWGPEIEKIKSKVSLRPAGIAQLIEDLNKQLKGKSFDGDNFLKSIFEAYKRILTFNDKPAGEKILVLDLLNELVFLIQSAGFRADPSKEKFKEYSRISFSYDLFRLRQQGTDLKIANQKLHLYVATFDATLEKQKALWIPDNEQGEGTYYSYISFSQQ